jgi:hypothetical protein
MADIGETCAGHQSDIARPDHRDFHTGLSSTFRDGMPDCLASRPYRIINVINVP